MNLSDEITNWLYDRYAEVESPESFRQDANELLVIIAASQARSRVVDVRVGQEHQNATIAALVAAGAAPGRPSLVPGTRLITIPARGITGPDVRAALDAAIPAIIVDLIAVSP